VVQGSSTISRDQADAQLEVLDRLAAVRLVADAVLIGAWPPDADVVDGLAMLTASAARWARVAATV